MGILNHFKICEKGYRTITKLVNVQILNTVKETGAKVKMFI